jgi:membrane-bound lytic murein transglycosylase MltF
MSTHKVTKQMFKDNAKLMPWDLLAAIAFSESSFDPSKRSSAGALGLMGFMPPTWDAWAPDGANPHDPEVSIRTADSYFRWLMDNTDTMYEALVAYMWGIGNVKQLGIKRAPDIVRERADAIVWARGMIKAWEALDGE